MPDLEEQIEEGLGEGPGETVVPPVKKADGTAGDATIPAPKSDEWKTALAELTSTVNKALVPKKEVAPQMTQEQLNEHWGVFDPEKTDKEFFKKMFRLPADATPEDLAQAKAVWGMMQNGLMKQAVKGALLLVEQKYGSKFAQIDSLEEWRSQASAKELRTNFNETYPALADPKFNKIIKLSAAELADSDFATHEDYFKALAERAAENVKTVDPSFDLGAVQTKPKTGKPSLPRTRVGGTGGTGGGGNAQKSASDDDSGSLEM